MGLVLVLVLASYLPYPPPDSLQFLHLNNERIIKMGMPYHCTAHLSEMWSGWGSGGGRVLQTEISFPSAFVFVFVFMFVFVTVCIFFCLSVSVCFLWGRGWRRTAQDESGPEGKGQKKGS